MKVLNKRKVDDFIVTTFEREISQETVTEALKSGIGQNDMEMLCGDGKCLYKRIEINSGYFAVEFSCYQCIYYVIDAIPEDEQGDRQLLGLCNMFLDGCCVLGDDQYIKERVKSLTDLAERKKGSNSNETEMQ